ncbi:MAG: hypothetical protein WA906_14170 [Pacificimonas sp.]
MLDHFRAHWTLGHDEAARSRAELAASPGRAAGRVAGWALARSVDYLKRFSRRPLAIANDGGATSSERAVLTIIEELASGNEAHARMRAQWLVPTFAVPGLISRLEPLADVYPQVARVA